MREKTKVKFEKDGRCPYCHDADLGGQNYRTCSSCNAKQHKRCWGDHGACAACGQQQNTSTSTTIAQKKPAQKKPAQKKPAQPAKRGIPVTKMIMGITILISVIVCAVLVPESRGFLVLLIFFGFGGFLSWLDR